MNEGVDLFSGCGGFTLAAEAEGISVVFAANHWDLAVDVHAANHPKTTHAKQLWWVHDGKYRLWSQLEVSRAMSFPDSYDFLGANKADTFRLLGNAVPPNLARGVISRVLGYA